MAQRTFEGAQEHSRVESRRNFGVTGRQQIEFRRRLNETYHRRGEFHRCSGRACYQRVELRGDLNGVVYPQVEFGGGDLDGRNSPPNQLWEPMLRPGALGNVILWPFWGSLLVLASGAVLVVEHAQV